MFRLVLATAIGVAVTVGAIETAQAQEQPSVSAGKDAEAKGLFEAGVAAFAEGRYEDALGYFKRSYQLSQRSKLLYNIGQVSDRLRRDQQAVEAFEEYLKQEPDAPNKAEVESRVRVLREAIERNKAKRQEAVAPAAVAAAPATEPASASLAAIEPTGVMTRNESERHDEKSGGLFSQWWFWTAAGVVVAGIVVGVAIAASGGGQERQGPLPGNTGVVVSTLRIAP